MNEYLSETINKLKLNNYTNLNIVIGNESCDLDSAVSSIVYAAYLNWLNGKSNLNENEKCITIPMLDVERDDYPLKTEVSFCLRDVGITDQSLLLSDDINLKQLMSKQISITLVDHHILSERLNFLTPYVKEIIDHRPLDKRQWKYNDVKSLIEIVGSCCTLVTKKINENECGYEFFNMYPTCGDLLHSVIVLDTVNFSKEVNKATPLDIEMIEYLENILKLENRQEIRKKKLERLLRARSDVTALTSPQLLRKDSKIVGDVFVPSFPILVKQFIQKPGSLEAVTEALVVRNCNIALLLGMDLSGSLKRDAAILSPDCPERGEKLAKFLQNWPSPPLELVPEPEIWVYFKQMNLSASRKQYMPALNEFILNCKQ